MFTKALINPSKLLLALSASALITACSYIPHDEDSLYIHGFIAPLGDSPLSRLEAGKSLKVSLSRGDNIISEKSIKTVADWPTAYKLEFHPPQLQALAEEEHTDALKISVSIEANASPATLVYQKQIELDSPTLFGTDYNILVTPYSVEPASENESTTDNVSNEAYNQLFTTFNCEGSEIKAAMNINFIVIQDKNEAIIPRSAMTPEPVYITNTTRFQFPQGKQFTYQQGEKEVQCQLNTDDFKPWQEAQILLKQAQEKQIAAAQKVNSNKSNPQ